MQPESCQVRSETESPCPRLAEVEILGVAFCEACARELEAYFAIGELTQEEAQGFGSKPLAEALERMRRERAAGSTEGIEAGMHHGHSVAWSGARRSSFAARSSSSSSFLILRSCSLALVRAQSACTATALRLGYAAPVSTPSATVRS
jgi:hypothetical protein